jgi:hypothetical protein
MKEHESVYDREYISQGVIDRIQLLHDRYYMYCCGHNEDGYDLSLNGATVARASVKRDVEILTFLNELLGHIDHDFVLSEAASKGYEKLCEPIERHRKNRRS